MTVNRSWQITGWRIIEVVQCSRPWSVNRFLWVFSGLPCPWKKWCRNTFWTRLLPESFKAWSLCTPPGLILRNVCLCPRHVQMSRPFLRIIISFFTVESRCDFCEVVPWRTNFSEQIFKRGIQTWRNTLSKAPFLDLLKDLFYNYQSVNPFNTEFICHLLALLETHHILHVSRIRVNGVWRNNGRLLWESYRIDKHTVRKNAAFLIVTAGGKYTKGWFKDLTPYPVNVEYRVSS
jgi:hypothetical protein